MEQKPRKAIKLYCDPEKGLTQQHFQEECDVNNIVKKFMETGDLQHVSTQPERYGYASSQSFTEAMFIVSDAKANFAQLPSEIRAAFNNDVPTYLDAIEDPDQQAKLADLGLIDSIVQDDPKTPPKASKEPKKDPVKSEDSGS